MIKTIFKIATKNVISKKSSIVIVIFIAFAVALLTVTNSVFDRTEKGAKEAFSGSFTGDVIIRPTNETPLSLFGDETPITGDLTKVPVLENFDSIHEFLSSKAEISKITTQVSGKVLLEFNGYRTPINLFGIDFESYKDCMDSLVFTNEIKNEDLQEKWLLLSETLANEIGAKIGDTIQFTVAEGISFRIRAVTVKGIYKYPTDNTVFSKIALTDSNTLRGLLNLKNPVKKDNDSSLIEENQTSQEIGENLDDLFFTSNDIENTTYENTEDLDLLFETSEDIEIENAADFEDSENSENKDKNQKIKDEILNQNENILTGWNFIICRTKNVSDSEKIISEANQFLSKNKIEAEAINWRSAAGNSALYLYILRMILNIGIIIILIAGLIVVNNTLVVNILDRTTEIATMRALGATKKYICFETFLETMILAFTSGVIGCIFGILGAKIVTLSKISFTNNFLIQLFGRGNLVTEITFSTLLGAFLFAIFLGAVAWINPVRNVLGMNLTRAMQGTK